MKVVYTIQSHHMAHKPGYGGEHSFTTAASTEKGLLVALHNKALEEFERSVNFYRNFDYNGDARPEESIWEFRASCCMGSTLVKYTLFVPYGRLRNQSEHYMFGRENLTAYKQNLDWFKYSFPAEFSCVAQPA